MIEPRTLPGFMELLPEDQIKFNSMIDKIRKSYEKFGFLPIDTPIIEMSDVLLAKAGGETEKQIYRFNKGENDLALRFDLTVPLAKYVCEYFNDITFPFKRYQIGKVYRGERPQKGRYREFYQCDIDIIGDGELKNEYKKIIKTKNLGNYIKMLGRKENPYPYYLMADYVVLVSNFEGFPVIYNEALYLKKPVLTTIDCSDDAINVGEDLAVIIEKNPNLISEVFIDAINKKINKKIKQVNYETINNNRINKFYEIIKEESK